MNSLADSLDKAGSLHRVAVPDLWQQEAVGALRGGRDVVVHAPTGAGKTLVFELWANQGKPRGQAIYTVPTRALANDKLAEWRSRGWDVGISTGDLSENLGAGVIVATLETQKSRLIAGQGPTLLVVDEYQMLADPGRGLNYELSIALAPPSTQLLLLSGSVANPQDVVRWLGRIGRRATVVKHEERPVPLEEVHAHQLNYHVPAEIRGYWPRVVAKALAEDLGPILIFAPRRQAAEALAAELTRQLPCPNPLVLSAEQRQMAGESLTRMLKARIAYHHSGLSYATRAGIVEPLAKAGQLRVVVATMGLAAGINFSLRSVALAGDSYRRDQAEQPLRSDEILQMFGRAGRRGIDETGYVLVSANELRLVDASPCQLSRSGMVDWGALLGVMQVAAEQGRPGFSEAVRVQERLFTTRPIFLGVEESMRHPEGVCGLTTDAERARFVRKRVREMLNSRGSWQAYPALTEVRVREVRRLLGEGCVTNGVQPRLAPILSDPSALERTGPGALVLLEGTAEDAVYGRAVAVAELMTDGRVLLAKWVRRTMGWPGRHAAMEAWQTRAAPALEARLAAQRTPVRRFVTEGSRIVAHLDISDLPMRALVDAAGVALYRPPEREVLPEACASCALGDTCRQLSAATGVALLWRRLGLVDSSGRPTLRGRVVSIFSQGDGLAVAAALEEETYPLGELLYDLANLDAGFRFCGEENRWGGRLARACHRLYGLQTIPGYLENGTPPKYGAGAEAVVAAAHQDPSRKHAWVSEGLGAGDIDRVIIEWRSLLRRIAHAPPLEWTRWTELQALARTTVHETESPTLTALPPLDYAQTKRVDHRLILRRH